MDTSGDSSGQYERGHLHRHECADVDVLGAPGEAPRKRKCNLRKTHQKVIDIDAMSSSSRLPPPDNRPSAGLSITLSNLLGKHGASEEQFGTAFYVCNDCKRIVSNEISRLDGHTCVIEVED